MNADEARHDRLMETATKAHQHCVAVNLARAINSILSVAQPTTAVMVEIADAEAAAIAADKALANWRSSTAQRI
jgi:hypothetical protein